MKDKLSKAADICQNILPFVEQFESEDFLAFGRLLHQRLREHQAYVTVIGETSTGKSTLINGLLPYNLLPAFARPASGTVVHLKLNEQNSPEFYVINRDASIEEINESHFRELAVNPDDNTLRLLTSIQPSKDFFWGLNVFDTPGYNSMIEGHEEALKEFIPNSDVLIFVCGYRTGFNQVDQDLFEVVRDSTPDKDIPIILAINRVPEGVIETDGRIKEIVFNAEDSLHQKLERVVMVGEASKKIDPNAKPYTDDLWHEANEIINDPDTQEYLRKPLLDLLNNYINNIISQINSKISYHALQQEDAVSLKEYYSLVKQVYVDSKNAVHACDRRLKNLVPPTLKTAADNIKDVIFTDIESSNRYLDKEDTFAWLNSHLLPFSIKKESRVIEDIIAIELNQLDDELESIANTAVKEIEKNIKLKSTAEIDIIKSMFSNIFQNAITKQIGRSLTRLGGVGGTAAGAGNFVKMAVKRFGGIFGKTFPRPVYDSIGRTFTKKFIARASAIFAIAFETISYIIDAHSWQGKLINLVSSSMDEWKTSTANELIDDVFPKIKKENLDLVDSIYKDDLSGIEQLWTLKEKEIEEQIVHYEKIKKEMQKNKDALIKLLTYGG